MQLLQRTVDVLGRLVAFDTSSHNTNKPLIDWIKAYLEQHDVAVTLLDDASGLKQNLIATIGDITRPGLVLSGHTDVVPADAGQWSGDPFRLRQEGDKLLGRGTTDMKGFLAIVLAAVPEMVKSPLAQPITLAFSYDEEVGCLGAPDLVAHIPPKQRVIVGEPTKLRPGLRHKGGRVQSLQINGVPAHSGTPHLGVNAISYAARAISELTDIQSGFNDAPDGYATTLTVGQISGGLAVNVVPDQCWLSWMLRATSKEDGISAQKMLVAMTNKLDAALKAENSHAAAKLETLVDVPPFLRGGLDATFSRLTQGRAPASLTFGTEAGIFSDAGHDVIVCGPGDMAQGHTVDEFITMQDLADGCHFIEHVIGGCRA